MFIYKPWFPDTNSSRICYFGSNTHSERTRRFGGGIYKLSQSLPPKNIFRAPSKECTFSRTASCHQFHRFNCILKEENGRKVQKWRRNQSQRRGMTKTQTSGFPWRITAPLINTVVPIDALPPDFISFLVHQEERESSLAAERSADLKLKSSRLGSNIPNFDPFASPYIS